MDGGAAMGRGFSAEAVRQYGLSLLLPGLSVALGALAAANHGTGRALLTCGVIVSTCFTAYLSQVRKQQILDVTGEAAKARIDLATDLTSGLRPVIYAVRDVCSLDDLDDAVAARKALIARAVSLPPTICGNDTTTGQHGHLRSAFYEWDGDRLNLRDHSGRTDSGPPRAYFAREQGAGPSRAIATALGENSVLVADLDERSVDDDYHHLRGRPYKTLIAVPVRSDQVSYGLLTVDSDIASTLTEIDRGYVIMLAALLASAYAHITGLTEPEPRAAPNSGDDQITLPGTLSAAQDSTGANGRPS